MREKGTEPWQHSPGQLRGEHWNKQPAGTVGGKLNLCLCWRQSTQGPGIKSVTVRKSARVWLEAEPCFPFPCCLVPRSLHPVYQISSIGLYSIKLLNRVPPSYPSISDPPWLVTGINCNSFSSLLAPEQNLSSDWHITWMHRNFTDLIQAVNSCPNSFSIFLWGKRSTPIELIE